MSLIARVKSLLRGVFHRSRLESEMDAEMRDHLERYTEDLVSAGLPLEEARRRAHMEFGAMEARKDECREAVGLRLWNDLRADLRYAIRMLRQSPGFTTIAVFSLALGIGANTAIFSLAETMFLKPLPVDDPSALRILAWTSGPHAPMESVWGHCNPGTSSRYCYPFSFPVFEELRRESRGFSSLFAFKRIGSTALIDGHAEPVEMHLVSGDYFSGLGVRPVIGRPLTNKDEQQKSFVAVISARFWERRFGSDPKIIGRHVSIADRALTIVGVAPQGFDGMHPGEMPDVFAPIALQAEIAPQNNASPLLQNADDWWVEIAGRLSPGVSDTAAQASLDMVLKRVVKAQLGSKKGDTLSLRLEPGATGYDDLRFQFSKSLFVLMGVVALVLLIACANLANLLLARAAVRQREMGIRLALGAGRLRLVRQALTESLTLAAAGGAMGVTLGYFARNAIPSLLSVSWSSYSYSLGAHFDNRVLAFAVGITLLTGLVFGLAPALRSTGVDVNSSLKVSGRSQTHGRSTQFASRSIVVFEVSMSVLLLVGAGLFLRTLLNLQSVRIGFNPQSIVLFSIDPPRSRYTGAKRIAFFRQLEEKVAAIPGVESSTLLEFALLAGNDSETTIAPPSHPNSAVPVWTAQAGDDFFKTMQLPILQGRPFGVHDRSRSPKVVVINETLAKAFFPGGDPIGQTLGSHKNTYGQIIGVCQDAKYSDLRQAPPPTAYFPFSQNSDAGSMTAVVRTHVSLSSFMAAARQALGEIDKDVPILDVRTQTEQIRTSLMTERLFAALTIAFGALAALLACVGVYGIMAYTVARRTNEIGIRMALGALSTEVLRMVLRETLALALFGIVIGVTVSLAVMRLVGSMLYGLKPDDPLTIAAALGLMITVALLAGWVPARRASRVDPMVALRQE